jgi:hypothetical protein
MDALNMKCDYANQSTMQALAAKGLHESNKGLNIKIKFSIFFHLNLIKNKWQWWDSKYSHPGAAKLNNVISFWTGKPFPLGQIFQNIRCPISSALHFNLQSFFSKLGNNGLASAIIGKKFQPH